MAILAAAPHLALSEEAKDGHSVDQSTTLPTVTVNARLSSESAKEVPFSLNVIGGEQLEERRLTSLEEALRQVPGVEVNSWGDASNASLRIRGVGALQRVSGDDSSVVIMVDGVPQSIGNASLNVLDIERVEVLKGPQGTLFGRNSEAGVVNVITRKPTRHVEGHVRGEVGQEGQRLIEGAVGGPLGETLSGRIALRRSGNDNPVTNARDGRPLSGPRELSLRGALLWEPAAATKVTLTASREALRGYAGFFTLRPYGDKPTQDVPPGSQSEDRTVDRYSAEINHDLGAAMFTSVTGYSKTDDTRHSAFYEGRLYQKVLGMRPDSRITYLMDEALYNQEFRLSSKPGDAVFWVVGANLFRTDRTLNTRDVEDGLSAANPFNADIDRRFETDSRALFGEVTVPVGDALKLTGGLRHTWEDKRYDAAWRANATNPSALRSTTDSQRLDDNYTTGRMALSYALSPRLNAYGVFARGYKTGGFSDFGVNVAYGLPDPAYGPAKIDSFETGFKYESADGKVGLNGALFHNDNAGDHLYVFDLVTYANTVENFDTRSRGLELDGFWRPGGGFTLSGGVAYTDAKIVGIPTSSTAGAKVGNRVPDSPRWSATLSIAHRMPVRNFFGMNSPVLDTRLTNRYVGARAADPQNNFELGAYNKLDMRIGIAAGSTEVYVWGDNLLDERYDLYGYYIPAMYPGGPDATTGTPSRGRTIGVGAALYF